MLKVSGRLILVSIILTLAVSAVIFYFSRADYAITFNILSVAAGAYLLLLPTLKLFKTRERSHAMLLFNKASYYPLALLLIVLVKIIL